MFIGVFGHSKAQIQSRFPKPGVAGSNPAEGADASFCLSCSLPALSCQSVAVCTSALSRLSIIRRTDASVVATWTMAAASPRTGSLSRRARRI